MNNSDINSLADAQNFLYLINPSDGYAYTSAFITAMQATNYDIILTDLFFDGSESSEFSAADITNLKLKQNAGSRLVIAYMSIGEAEDYRYYWQSAWESNPPDWIEAENPDWPGNYKVRYWNSDWQDIIFGNAASYLQRIIDAGFDGVYLDIIDAYEYFE